MSSPRPVCLRCRRPAVVCWCHAITAVPSKTHVAFIQHPLEARVPISTCRMAHLSLPNSSLHVAWRAFGEPTLEQLCSQPRVSLLFPSEEALDLEAVVVPPQTLIVVDGTWSKARKLVERCPVLSTLPRLKFFAPQPSNYRIRKEPQVHCLATIEATAYALERLEHAPGRFTPILSVFDAMVETQLAYRRASPTYVPHRDLKAAARAQDLATHVESDEQRR